MLLKKRTKPVLKPKTKPPTSTTDSFKVGARAPANTAPLPRDVEAGAKVRTTIPYGGSGPKTSYRTKPGMLMEAWPPQLPAGSVGVLASSTPDDNRLWVVEFPKPHGSLYIRDGHLELVR